MTDEEEEFDLAQWAQEQPVVIPDFRDPFPATNQEVPHSVIFTDDGQVADALDFAQLNEQIDSTRLALYSLTQKIHEADIKLTKAELEYTRRYNRAYLSIDAKTEKMRSAYAEIVTEQYQNKVVTRKAILKDLMKRSAVLAQSLDVLKQMSFNFRKEVDASR